MNIEVLADADAVAGKAASIIAAEAKRHLRRLGKVARLEEGWRTWHSQR